MLAVRVPVRGGGAIVTRHGLRAGRTRPTVRHVLKVGPHPGLVIQHRPGGRHRGPPAVRAGVCAAVALTLLAGCLLLVSPGQLTPGVWPGARAVTAHHFVGYLPPSQPARDRGSKPW